MNEPAVTSYNGMADAGLGGKTVLYMLDAVICAPSGTVYTDSSGNTVTNLGVHEHWNNSAEKKYSRNLGKTEGIELVKLGPDR